MQKKKARRKAMDFFFFVTPAFLLIFFSSLVPFLSNIYYSVMKWDGVNTPVFVGLRNYINLFTNDTRIIESFGFTLKYLVFTVILTNVIALLIALLLDSKIKSKNALRTAFFLPNALSALIAGFMFSFIFSMGFSSLYDITGWQIFNWSWLSDVKLAWISVGSVDVWRQMGYFMVIYIAGLQSVPQDVMESARVDGANGWKTFWKITLPLLMPSITVCLFLSMSNALNVFDIPYALTGGGPGYSTTGMPLNIYKEAFENSMFGYASAKSLIYFVVVVVFSFMQLKATKSREVEA